jgi:hypothetical protein
MAGFHRPWALCGGWAVDAWLGRQTREHLDVDLAIDDDDQLALRGYLRDGWLLNGHDPHDDDSTQAWDGHPLELPAHIHARGHDLDLDFQLNAHAGDALVLGPTPRTSLARSEAVATSPWGLPTFTPVAILFFKRRGPVRPNDQTDIDLLTPLLGTPQQAWLSAALAEDAR